MTLVYISSQSAILSFGEKIGQFGGKSMYGRWSYQTGSGIAIDDDGRHAELAQPRSERDAALSATDDDHVRLGDVAELSRLALALLEPGFPIRDGAVLRALGSPVALLLLIACELVQRRQQRPRFAVSEPQVTQAPADRGLELDPALCIRAGLAQFAGDGETAWPHSVESLTEHLAYPIATLDGDDVPGECDQVAPVAVFYEQVGRRIDVTVGQSPLEVCQPPGHDASCSRGADRSIRSGVSHRGTPSGGLEGSVFDRAEYLTGETW